jgi:hypothetical protein
MDSEKTKQHDNHVQRDDGHEQDDENPQSGRDERQEHSCALKKDPEESHEQDDADDGSNHVRDRDRQASQPPGSRGCFTSRRLARDFPAGAGRLRSAQDAICMLTDG